MKRMLLGLCFVLSFGLFALASPVRAAEQIVTSSIPNGASLIFSEVYPNGLNSDESGSEFVEVYNQSTQTVTLSEYELSRPDSSTTMALTGSLEPGAYLAVYPSFSLVNSGGTVSLTHKSTGTITSITYASAAGADENFAYHLTDSATDTWNKLSPTPNKAPPAEPEEPSPEEPDEEDPEQPKPCSITNVHLSEIAANPGGSDTHGGEFIEFFNNNDTPASLEGCTLTSDKLSGYTFTSTDTIPAKSFYAITLADKLLNSGGSVTFQTATYEEVVQYNALGNDEAWALINGAWQLTTLATPNNTNQPSPGKGAGDVEIEEESAPCPAGKYRNSGTGRCKNIEVSIATVTPCGPGKERSPETNRCRNIVAASASLAPCEPGQERNSETNRCRKIAAMNTDELTPCKEGYERSPETNRCRKVVSAVANTAHIDDNEKQNPTHDLLVLGAAGAAIGGFLLYEYKSPIAAQFRRLRFPKK